MIFLANFLFILYFLSCTYIPRFLIYNYLPSEIDLSDNSSLFVNQFIFSCLFCFFLGTIFITLIPKLKVLLFNLICKIDRFFLRIKLQNSSLIFFIFCFSLSLYPIFRFASSVNSFRASGNQGFGILSIWTGQPILFAALYYVVIKLKNLKNFKDFLLYGFPILLISVFPSVILSNRSIIFVWLFATIITIYPLLDKNKYFLGSLKRKFIIYTVFLLPVTILASITITRFALYENPFEFLTLILRVDGLSALERVIEFNDAKNAFSENYFSSLFIEPLTIMIPRTIWPSKPIPISIQMTQDIFSFIFLDRGWETSGNEGGVSATFFGEILYAGGYLTAYIFSFIWGIFGTILSFMMQYSNSYFSKTILGFLIGFFIFSAESYSISTNAAISLLIPIFIISTLSILIFNRKTSF